MTEYRTIRSLEPPTCDDRPIWDIYLSFLHFPALIVADEIGLFSLLAEMQARRSIL